MKTPQVDALPGMTPLGFNPNRFATTPATTHSEHYRIAANAFAHAIKKGVLQVDDMHASNYAGNFMYMGVHAQTGWLQFKDIVSRQYTNCDWR